MANGGTHRQVVATRKHTAESDVSFLRGRLGHLVALLERTRDARTAAHYVSAALGDLSPVLRRLGIPVAPHPRRT